ncbi:uncharacterized protein LOC129951887 [Eupeodes corollae]|uniref:uncharacterized protein LOC129951887 n=1 Tax=Eupeodes corollae TaxID=290404 RepID=UPI002490308D|nr:uncharacterized protein LOC129951887 [Eupeodes corollae]
MQDDCEGTELNEGVANDGGLGKGLGEVVEVKETLSGKQGGQNHINAEASTGSLYAPSHENLYVRQVVSRELPIFSGTPEEWPLFFSSFQTSTRICGLSNDENLLRLQRSLKGKAFEYVSHSLTLPALVPEIMSTLRMAFGRPEHIINNLLAKIRSTAPVNPNRLDSLINFSLEVKGIVATMEASGLVSYLNNPLLLQDIIDKLPVQKRIDWAMHSENINEVNLKTLSDWLFKFAEAASRVMSTPITSSLDSERRKVHRLNFHETSSTPSQGNSLSTFRCYACDGPHGIINCEQFSMLNYNEKWSVVNTNKLCHSCLRHHDAKLCRNRRECQVDGCDAKHHPLLHKLNTAVTKGCTDYAGVVAIHNMQTSKVLYRIVPITIFGKNTSVDVYAFLDDGSGPTLIERDILSQIGSQGITSDLCLRWTDGTVRIETNSHHLDLQRQRGKTKIVIHYGMCDPLISLIYRLKLSKCWNSRRSTNI